MPTLKRPSGSECSAYRGGNASALLKQMLGPRGWWRRCSLPRWKRLGLIEAHLSYKMLWVGFPTYRGGNASALLKQRLQAHPAGGQRPYRGGNASALLKHGRQRFVETGQRTYRGGNASALLKLDATGDQLFAIEKAYRGGNASALLKRHGSSRPARERLGGLPRWKRLGLIEAASVPSRSAQGPAPTEVETPRPY